VLTEMGGGGVDEIRRGKYVTDAQQWSNGGSGRRGRHGVRLNAKGSRTWKGRVCHAIAAWCRGAVTVARDDHNAVGRRNRHVHT
jgi:hypothetical protein